MKRSYDTRLRLQKSAETQKIIIETLVTLLKKSKGGEVTFEEVSKRSKIPLRTIYRLFKDKETLHEAMDAYLFSYLQAGTEQLSQLDFVGFGKNAFKLFDQNEDLVMAYLYSPFGHEARTLFRKRLNQAMTEKILERRKIGLTEEKKKRLALVLSLVNAKIWHDIKIDWGYDGHQMSESLGWALETLLKEI